MRNLFAFAASCVLLLSLKSTSLAQTNITSNITGNTTWDASGSPFIILNTIAVDTGVTLTILPGVAVKFESGVDLNVRGTIMALGDSLNPIIFTSNLPNPSPGVWGGVAIWNTSGSTSLIEYSQFTYALSGVSIQGASPTVQNCELSQTLFSAVQINGGSALIQQNDIHSTKGASVFVGAGGTPVITNNLLHDNEQDGVHVGSDASPIIDHNIIFGSQRYGINSSTGCIIFNNTIDANGTAINCDNESPQINNNIITNHPTIGIRAVNGASPSLSYNDVWNNGTNYFGTSQGVGDISLNPNLAKPEPNRY